MEKVDSGLCFKILGCKSQNPSLNRRKWEGKLRTARNSSEVLKQCQKDPQARAAKVAPFSQPVFLQAPKATHSCQQRSSAVPAGGGQEDKGPRHGKSQPRALREINGARCLRSGQDLMASNAKLRVELDLQLRTKVKTVGITSSIFLKV